MYDSSHGIASGLCWVAGTADGFNKKTAVSRAQRALDDYINQYKANNNLGAVTIRAMRAEPQPYWRRRVSENMMYQPDIVTANSHTVCWQGVISFYVCTPNKDVAYRDLAQETGRGNGSDGIVFRKAARFTLYVRAACLHSPRLN
jgi:hypothetical protein